MPPLTKDRLEQIPVERIRPNEDNPRITFRPDELGQLQESIRQFGVRVPISVYKDGSDYILIDGERRWRCSLKLNRKTIPAIIQDRPTPLENLLLMFNIHSLREQWDLLTIALKLPRIIELFRKARGSDPKEADLTAATGLRRGVIRRCKLLMELPEKYKKILLTELKKPKTQQKLSEDFFIEMEKAITTVQRAIPDLISNRNHARDVFLEKYEKGVIENLVDFRKIAKIARAEKVGADPVVARNALARLLNEVDYTIDRAFNDTVSEAYAERDIVSRIDSLLSRLTELDKSTLDEETREKLEELIDTINGLLGAAQ